MDICMSQGGNFTVPSNIYFWQPWDPYVDEWWSWHTYHFCPQANVCVCLARSFMSVTQKGIAKQLKNLTTKQELSLRGGLHCLLLLQTQNLCLPELQVTKNKKKNCLYFWETMLLRASFTSKSNLYIERIVLIFKSTTASTVMPNSLESKGAGALAPNELIPIDFPLPP